jgi:hypothetical protein
MLAQRSMYDSAIEENLRSVGNVVEDLQGFLELVIVIVGKRFHPCFDFLYRVSRFGCHRGNSTQLAPASTTYPSRSEAAHCGLALEIAQLRREDRVRQRALIFGSRGPKLN